MSSSDIPNFDNDINEKNLEINNFNNDINKENINNNNINNIMNDNESNPNKMMSSKEWLNYFNQSKINLEQINNALLSNVESIDNENIKLKEAINELIKDLKEKEDSLEESLALISKLKNNYSNLFHQYQTLEKKYIRLTEENEKLKIEKNLASKKLANNESQKNFKEEINKMKKDELNIKNNLVEKKNENSKLIKENSEIKTILEDLKERNLEFLGMIKDREEIISEYANQIKNLENEINDKNEQIKLLVKFSKNINDENKTNVKELTKQACQTIKLFYNYNKQNNENYNDNNDIKINHENGNSKKIIKMIFNNDDLDELKLSNNNEICNNNKSKNVLITFKLKEAILNNISSSDDLDIGNMNGIKEYLINIFIKINLLKLELFSSYIREFHFVSFWNNLINKINCDSNASLDLLNLRSKIIELKTKQKKLLAQNNELTMKLFEFKNRVNELNLYIKKIKGEVETKNSKIKQKVEKIIDFYENKIDNLYDKIDSYKTKNNKNCINYFKNKEKYNNKYLKKENEISFNIAKKLANEKIDIKSIKNNRKKNFNFSLTQSSENNNNQNKYNSMNKPTLKDSIFKKSNISNINNFNNSDIIDKKYYQNKLENEKLKDEISHLRKEITELVKDINKQQKLLSESNSQTKITCNNNCIKCDFLNNLIKKSNLPDTSKLSQIKNIIINGSFLDSNIKNIISNIFNFIAELLNNAYYNSIEINFNKILFSELNEELLSSSELKKYYLIYGKNIKNINDLVNIYEKRINDIKNNFQNLKLNSDSSISEQNNNSFNKNKNFNITNDERIEDNNGYDYKNVKDEIIKLKQEKIIIDNTVELIKNFLVVNEKIFNFFVKIKNNIEQYKQYYKKIFNTFKESIYYNLDDTCDNNIFLKKLISNLLESNI